MITSPQLGDEIIDDVVSQSERSGLVANHSTLQAVLNRQELKSLLKQATETYQENYEQGLRAFERLVDAQAMKKLRSARAQQTDRPSESSSATATGSDSLSDGEFDCLLSQGIQEIQDGRSETGAAMLSVLVTLRPTDPRCYIGFGTAIWQTSGVQKAAQFYEILTESWEQPELAYFAADSLFEAGRLERARQLLERSVAVFQKQPRQLSNYDVELFDNMTSLLDEIEFASKHQSQSH
ncbi:hypothetical protein AB1L42_01270 [Thalassoglobus sp. JC818]|uniref:tetratricopeptide repeat protein n=1 Tax=Thalassoglobus sp. JC818 TaxID=3232136 RepID=UPI003459D177